MAEQLEELWRKLSFTEEEDEGIALGSRSTRAAKARGRLCVVLKILSQRRVLVDALRKNLRMLWKPSKGVNISELEDDLFLAEFGDERDKKRIMDMSPWSFEKQLVLIQEFEGDLTPREMDVIWSPFWVQIFNLPLKCRTKETACTIGSKLEAVLEVDVADSGVQWGKYLRVRVKIDCSKKLVRGKKVTIEGGESRWVQFKYERLPNFCYRCGLLNHALRDCPEPSDLDGQSEEEQLQYGAWLRGEPGRRGVVETGDQSSGLTKAKKATGGETEKKMGTSDSTNEPEKVCKEGRADVAIATDQGKEGIAWDKPTYKLPDQSQRTLHGNRNVGEGGGKVCMLDAQSSDTNLVNPTGIAERSPRMGWELTHNPENEPTFNFVLAPNVDQEVNMVDQAGQVPDMGPMAMCFDPTEGWVSSQLGPTSRHWIRKIRDAKPSEPKGEKSPKKRKRGSPIPVIELDTTISNLKRRKS